MCTAQVKQSIVGGGLRKGRRRNGLALTMERFGKEEVAIIHLKATGGSSGMRQEK